MASAAVAIPAWNALGLLPPIDAAQPTSPARSPYPVRLPDLVQRFATSTERRTVLGGFLRFRADLHRAGLVRGFQWLDGSFTEHVEVIEQRAPRDIDVVTFFRLPDGVSQTELARREPALFDHGLVKTRCHVDGYWVDLATDAERLVARSAYWYGMWSHRRNQAWKGYLQVGLADDGDAEALASLGPQGDEA